MNSRLERFIESAYAVGSEEKNTSKVPIKIRQLRFWYIFLHISAHSSCRKNTATIAFLSRSWNDRSSKNTSASSRSTTAPQFAEMLKMRVRFESRIEADVPRSPAPTM